MSMLNLGFWVLSVLIFCNVNGITYLLFGVLGIVSPIIILCCIFILLYLKLRKSDFTKTSLLLITSIATVFLFGLLPAIFNYGSTNFEFSFLEIAFREASTSILIFTIFFAYFQRINDEQKDKFLNLTLVLFVFTTAFGAFEPFLGLRDIYSSFTPSSRNLGFFGNPNETGLQANYTLALCLGLFMRRKINLILTVLVSCLAIYTSVSSFSKMAMLTTIIVLLIFITYTVFNGRKFSGFLKNRIVSYFIVIAVLATMVIVPNALSYYENLNLDQQRRIENLSKLVWEGKIDSKTTSHRDKAFIEALELIKNKPLFGYGTHTFSKAGMFTSREDIGVHNLFLKIWGEAGIIPLIIFLWFIGSYFKQTLYVKDPGIYFMLTAVFVIYLLFGFSDHTALGQKVSIALLGIMVGILSSAYYKTSSE